MSSPNWEIWLDDPQGRRLALLDTVIRFRLTQVTNDTGAFELALPGDFDDSLIRPDGLVEFWRGHDDGALKLVSVYFIQRIGYHDEDETTEVITLAGADLTELLSRRIVAYYAGTAYTSKTDNAGDIIKALVRENLGSSATDTDRDLSDYLSIDSDLGDGYSLTKGCSWRNLLTVCQEIADASAINESPIFFGFVPTFSSSGIVPVFRTWAGQPGQDHSGDSDTPVYFGKEIGNLTMPYLTYDYTEEATVVYVGGQNEQSSRDIVEVEDATRSGRTIWGRREAFVNAVNEKTTAALTSRGQAKLEASRPRLRFGCGLLDSDQARFGIDWAFGDRVAVEYRGKQFDALVRAIELAVDGPGQEHLAVRAEIETDV